MNVVPQGDAASDAWLHFAADIVDRAGVLDERTATVLVRSFARVSRDLFFDSALQDKIFEDEALPIGYGETCPRPSLIARMLALVGLRKGMRILEVGCGCGYASAVMAAAGASVFATENVGPLAQLTRRRLDQLYLGNIIIHRGDGHRGWYEHAPFDAVVISHAVDRVEPELLSQLVKPGGRLVTVLNGPEGSHLTLWESKAEEITHYQLESCTI